MIQLVWRTFGRSMTLIPAHYRRQSYGIAALLLTQSFLDVLGLGLIVSLAPMLFDRERVMRFSLYKRINYALGEPTYQTTLVVALVIIVVAYAVKNAISIWIAHRQARFAFNIYHSLTTRLHKLSFDRGYLYLRKRNSTEVVRDVAAIPGRFSENILLPLLLFLNEALVLLVVVLSVLWLDPYAFVFVALIVLPPSLVFFHLVKNHVSQVQERVNLLSAQLQKSLFESIFGYADVRTTRTQDYFFSRYSALVKDYCGCLRLSTVYNVLPGRLLELFFVLGVVSLGAYIAFRIQDAGLATTFLATYAIAAYRTLPSINRMTLALLSIKGHQYTLDVLEDAREAPAASGEPTSQPLPFDREINFDAVSYRYPDGSGETLNQISLTIQKGECVGIVGPSGSGKTTILNLLLGFLRPTSGRILIDRTELTPDRHGAWYRLIGYVQQEVFLLEGTLRENIVFGVPSDQVDIGRLNDVIRLASLEEFIGSLPQSVDTPVGERGATLSVGQKQRIGIARALYSGAQILIFDEATSALDPGTEAEITESIRQLSLEGYTVIIVAHRVTTLRHTQRIIELKKGALSHETTYGAISRQL